MRYTALTILLLLSGFAFADCIGATQNFAYGDTITESCTMDGDMSGSGTAFVIGSSDITIDCAGYSVAGDYTGNGIEDTTGYTGVIIQNCNFMAHDSGVFTYGSIHVLNTNISDVNSYGIYIGGGIGGSVVDGVSIDGCNSGSGIEADSENNLIIANTKISNSYYYGLYLDYIDGGIVENVSVYNSQGGYEIYDQSTTNMVYRNIDMLCTASCMQMDGSAYARLTNITAAAGGNAFLFTGAQYNLIANSTGSGDGVCVYFDEGSQHNEIANSTFDCTAQGIYFYGASENWLYNNLINSTQPAYEEDIPSRKYCNCYPDTRCGNPRYPLCQWHVLPSVPAHPNYFNASLDDTTPNIVNMTAFGGNYWAQPDGLGWSETCASTKIIGICDSPYPIPSSSGTNGDYDYLPLTLNPFSPPSGASPCQQYRENWGRCLFCYYSAWYNGYYFTS